MTNSRHFLKAATAAVALALLAFSGAPASAQGQGGLFDLFRPQRAEAPAHTLAYADPSATMRAPATNAPSAHVASGSGRTVAYCVRLCDGRHFPIQVHGNASAVTLCNSFCPAATTKVFSGSDISRAVARDGSRYTALEHAFAYRTRIVSDCTCNGKDSFGVAAVDISADPTLRNGDIVATGGPVAYAASSSKR
jgi:Protein of unknown function (DUF2865)